MHNLFFCRYVFDDRDRHWDHHVKDGRQQLSWEDYLKRSYGMVEGDCSFHRILVCVIYVSGTLMSEGSSSIFMTIVYSLLVLLPVQLLHG